MLCGPVLTPSRRHMFALFGANKPLLTPHLGVSSKNRHLCNGVMFFKRWNVGNFTRIRHQRCFTPFPLFNSTVLAAGRTSRETLHSSAFYCLCLGGNEKTFSFWFQQYKQILVSLNLFFSQMFILLRYTGAKDWHTQGDGWLRSSTPDERFSWSQVIYLFSSF